jgi:hypothetical protein
MTTSDELVARFRDPAGFKKYIGFLGGKLAKKAYDTYSSADESGAAKSYTLDFREHEGNSYWVKAISVRGDLTPEVLGQLEQAAQLLPLGVLRYEGMMAPVIPDPIGSDDEADVIHGLSRPDEGIIVYPVSIMSKKKDAAWVLWARTGDDWYVYPLEDKKL